MIPPGVTAEIDVPPGFSLRETCGPVAWGKGRWPNVDWLEGTLVWVGYDGGERTIRVVSQPSAGRLAIGSSSDDGHAAWAARTLGSFREPPAIADLVVTAAAARFPGLRPFAAGSLFDGLVTSIAGQSISVAAAAVTERRLAELFAPPVAWGGRQFWPMPTAEQLADADPARVRESGVTWRRAEAIVRAARAWLDGELPDDAQALADEDDATTRLRELPLVGEWTARSALLWGVGARDAFPPNDAALLRAARAAYGRVDLDHRGLNVLAEGWRPGRAWAARWLWTGLLGVPAA